jgi:Tfp pilus assembly protein PilF
LAKIDAAMLDNPAVMMSRGKLCYHEKDAAQAMKMFTESLAREETPDAFLYTGFIAHDGGRREEAEASFAHAASLGNKSPEIMNRIGRFFAEKGEYARANGCYKQALEEILKTGGK